MEHFNLDSDAEFRELLVKASLPKSTIDLTQSIMDKVYAIELKTDYSKKYQLFSWVFIVLAAILSVFSVWIVDKFGIYFYQGIIQYIPSAGIGFLYFFMVCTLSVLLYQFNNMLTHRHYMDIDAL